MMKKRMMKKAGGKASEKRPIGGTTFKPKNKVMGIIGSSKKDQKKYYDMTRAASRDMNKTGQGKKFRDLTRVEKKTGQIKLKRKK
jgi:hypothetical protein